MSGPRPIELHADDVDAVTAMLYDIEEAGGYDVPGLCLEDLPDDDIERWRCWARAACAGASARACGVHQVAWVAARKLAMELGELRRRLAVSPERKPVMAIIGAAASDVHVYPGKDPRPLYMVRVEQVSNEELVRVPIEAIGGVVTSVEAERVAFVPPAYPERVESSVFDDCR